MPTSGDVAQGVTPMPTPGSTTARGYGATHQKLRATWQARINRGDHVTCWRCGRPITPGQPMDLGHDDHDRTITRGPEHRHATAHCVGNRAAGAAKARQVGPLRRPRIRATPLDEDDW